MTSFWCFYCKVWTCFTPFSSVSIVDFEQKKNVFTNKCIEGIADQTENIADLEKLETQSPKTTASRTPSCYYV